MEYSESKIRPRLDRYLGIRSKSPYSKIKVMVKNLDTGEVFTSMTRAAKEYKVDVNSIKRAIKDPHRKCCGCSWVPYTSDDALNDEWNEYEQDNY